ncbi:hypothetical protein BJ508DRAFT_331021 [Ascobolus immersus RN42]|uniref:F-box domain-containing protein n=1 Tax=Ascobolus immersus RN42 TaxID=1160509 RepID=A0A3N4HS96_ASCIM|nr:hypothetical protein BJ508DRAFT_331021 [Ascobolus immersus RN42]
MLQTGSDNNTPAPLLSVMSFGEHISGLKKHYREIVSKYRPCADWGQCPEEYWPDLARAMWPKGTASVDDIIRIRSRLGEYDMIKGMPAKAVRSSSPDMEFESSFRLLDLPNKLIHKICTYVDSPLTFLLLGQVNQRLNLIISTPYTRQSFSQQWIQTYCDGNRGPDIIEYIVRFLHRHCVPPHTCTHRESIPLAGPYEDGDEGAEEFMLQEGTFIVEDLYGSLIYYPDSGVKHERMYETVLGDIVAASPAWRKTLFDRIISRDNAIEEIQESTLSSLQLDIEDAVLAYELWKFWHYRGVFHTKLFTTPILDMRWHMMREKWDCRCGAESSVLSEQPNGPETRVIYGHKWQKREDGDETDSD